MTADKVDHAVMGPSEIVARENLIRLRGEIAVGKEQQLDPLPHLIPVGKGCDNKGFYVSHIDVPGSLGYRGPVSAIEGWMEVVGPHQPNVPREERLRCP